jgi:hypothetical protein
VEAPSRIKTKLATRRTDKLSESLAGADSVAPLAGDFAEFATAICLKLEHHFTLELITPAYRASHILTFANPRAVRRFAEGNVGRECHFVSALHPKRRNSQRKYQCSLWAPVKFIDILRIALLTPC